MAAGGVVPFALGAGVVVVVDSAGAEEEARAAAAASLAAAALAFLLSLLVDLSFCAGAGAGVEGEGKAVVEGVVEEGVEAEASCSLRTLQTFTLGAGAGCLTTGEGGSTMVGVEAEVSACDSTAAGVGAGGGFEGASSAVDEERAGRSSMGAVMVGMVMGRKLGEGRAFKSLSSAQEVGEEGVEGLGVGFKRPALDEDEAGCCCGMVVVEVAEGCC